MQIPSNENEVFLQQYSQMREMAELNQSGDLGDLHLKAIQLSDQFLSGKVNLELFRDVYKEAFSVAMSLTALPLSSSKANPIDSTDDGIDPKIYIEYGCPLEIAQFIKTRIDFISGKVTAPLIEAPEMRSCNSVSTKSALNVIVSLGGPRPS